MGTFYSMDQINQPQNFLQRGLLNPLTHIGLGLLSASAPRASWDPGGATPNYAQGLLSGVQSYQQMQEARSNQQYRAALMQARQQEAMLRQQKAAQELAQAQRQAQAQQQYLQGLPPEQRAQAGALLGMGTNPGTVHDLLNPTPNYSHLKSVPGVGLVDVSQQGAPVVRAQQQPPGKTPEQIRAEAFARKGGELDARRANIDQVLGQVSAAMPGSIPLVQRTGRSRDASRVDLLFSQASALNRAGETAMANALLSEARFLADTSPQVRREKYLNEPLTVAEAAQLGLPVGSTRGQALGMEQPSPAQSAADLARARRIGATAADNEQTVAFLQPALNSIQTVLAQAEQDPTILGAGGSLRSTGQTALQVIGDLGARPILEKAKEIALSSSDLDANQYEGLFDSPTLSVLQLLENSIGLAIARMEVPSGRIPVDVIKRSIDSAKLTGLTGSGQVQNRLRFHANRLQQSINVMQPGRVSINPQDEALLDKYAPR